MVATVVFVGLGTTRGSGARHADVGPDLPAAVGLVLPEGHVPSADALLLLTFRLEGVGPGARLVRRVVDQPDLDGANLDADRPDLLDEGAYIGGDRRASPQHG